MKMPVVCLIAVFVSGCACFGQTFEVASVKVNHAQEPAGRGMHGPPKSPVDYSPGTLSLRNATLSAAVQYAYNVKEYQVTGPAWLTSERYDIVGKAASAAAQPEMRVMLQNLLAERFKLAFHRDTKEMPVFVLVPAPGGIKMQESQGDGEPSFSGRGPTATAKNQTMSALVDMMIGPIMMMLGRPIIDQTGLTKRYDISIDMSAMMGPGMMGPGMQLDELVTALPKLVQDQLGLKLEPKKVPVELLIIDHAEKIPTEN